MIKLVTKLKAPTVENGKLTFTEQTEKALVASTKSKNNYNAELQPRGYFLVSQQSQDFYLDKAKTVEKVAEMVDSLCPNDAFADDIIEHIMKALDNACVFYKPKK